MYGGGGRGEGRGGGGEKKGDELILLNLLTLNTCLALIYVFFHLP